jgi:hypothetical protein
MLMVSVGGVEEPERVRLSNTILVFSIRIPLGPTKSI